MGLFLIRVSNYIHPPIYTIHRNTPTLREKEKKREREGGEGGEEEEEEEEEKRSLEIINPSQVKPLGDTIKLEER